MGISSKTFVGNLMKKSSFGLSDKIGITHKQSRSPAASAADTTTPILPATQEMNTQQSYQDLARAQMRRNSFLSSIYSGSAGGTGENSGGKLGG